MHWDEVVICILSIAILARSMLLSSFTKWMITIIELNLVRAHKWGNCTVQSHKEDSRKAAVRKQQNRKKWQNAGSGKLRGDLAE